VNEAVDFEAALRPGQAVSAGNPARLYAGTGFGGSVEILELQPAGKKRMSAAEFLRGHSLKEGDHFGPETS
jgi:methionyl-tRNA formyltransferase